MAYQPSFLAAITVAIAIAGGGVSQAQSPQGVSQQGGLRTALHLRPEQMNAFNAYQSASRPTADQLTRLKANSPQALVSLTTPQRLDRINAFLNLQMQVFQHSAEATRNFYNQLSPQQQQTFDRVTAPRSGGGGQG